MDTAQTRYIVEASFWLETDDPSCPLAPGPFEVQEGTLPSTLADAAEEASCLLRSDIRYGSKIREIRVVLVEIGKPSKFVTAEVMRDVAREWEWEHGHHHMLEDYFRDFGPGDLVASVMAEAAAEKEVDARSEDDL